MSDPRDTTIRLRVTSAEAARLAEAAREDRRSLSDWVRDRLGLPLRDERPQPNQRPRR